MGENLLMRYSPLAPWMNEQATRWLATSEQWLRLLSMVKRTLENDAQRFPHQIRAASAVVIMLCREGYWPARFDQRERDEIVALAKRQLTVVRQAYAFEARSRPELLANPDYKAILQGLDDELRLLDARMADEPANLPDRPPSCWGKFLRDNAR
jgi:hypothetical protein